MNKKIELLVEAYNYRGNQPEKNYTCSNFIKSFVKDFNYFGEETSSLYQAFYGIDEETLNELQNNISYLKEMVEEAKTPFLIEEDGSESWKSLINKKREPASPGVKNAMEKIGTSIKGTVENASNKNQLKMDISPDVIEKPEVLSLPTQKITPTIDPETLPKIPSSTYIAASKASTSQEAIATLIKGTGSKVSGGAAGVIAPIKPKMGVLGLLGSIWNKIKSFFGGGVKTIGDTIKTGNYAHLIQIPLVQGALAAGGVALAVAILKKIFGKKRINAQKFNATIQARQKAVA